MDTRSTVRFDAGKYNTGEFDRASSHNTGTIIKYIAPRVVGPNLPNNSQSSLRGTGWSNVGSSFTTVAKTESLGLASLAQSATFSTISSIHSIDGQRIIDEHRELSKVTEILANSILQCCNLQAHNQAQELQLEWLQTHRQQTSSVIEKMYLTEANSAKKLINESLHQKPLLESKLNDVLKSTDAQEEKYEQLLVRRNACGKELFDFERQIAQNNAEAQFLQRRLHYMEDESKFYSLKNQGLLSRLVRLRFELDEETFSEQSLQLEQEILESEKITHEDVHLTAVDEVQNSIDLSQIGTIQPSKYFYEQLNIQVQRIRTEYESKMEVYREELHRKFELELHRYQVYKSLPAPNVTRDHGLKLEQYEHERKDVVQQIAAIRGRMNEVIIQIETMEKQVTFEQTGNNSTSNTKRHVAMLNQLIRDREIQLDQAIHTRAGLKQRIESYKDQLHRYSRQMTQTYYNKRATIHESVQSSVTANSFFQNSNFRSSLQELSSENRERERSLTPRLPPKIMRSTSPPQRSKHSSSIQPEESWEEGTLTRFADFNIDQDCHELHRSLNESNIDELAIIQTLCNRSVSQRLQIRDEYKNRLNRNLGDDLEKITNNSLNKLLRMLLLSPIEHDCYELRRLIKGPNVDENILIEFFFSRSNRHIQTIRDSYEKLFSNTLEQDITGDRYNPSKRIFLTLLQSNRPEDNDVDDNEVLNDARGLYETAANWQTDGSAFLRLLCTRSNIQLKQIFKAYQQFSKIDIEHAIKLHTNGNLSYTLMDTVRIIRNRPRFFAYELKRSLKGASTNEDNLNRIIISRCEIDMVQIKSEYEKVTKRTLYDQIQTDITGNYKRALIELLRQRIEPNTRELTFTRSNEQTEVFKRPNSARSSVQWRTSVNENSSDASVKRTFTRTASDRTTNRTTRNDDNQLNLTSSNSQFDSNNQAKTSSLIRISPKSPKSQHIDRRSFVPLPPTFENHS